MSGIMLALIPQLAVRQPSLLGELGGPLVGPVAERDARPPAEQAEADRPGHAPGAEDQDLLVRQGAGGHLRSEGPP